VGVGETRYARWGEITDTSEHALACEAILRAVEDAGVRMDEVDGFCSFAEDRNDAVFLARELGLRELRFANMVWLPGGGGGCAAVANAAMAVEAGQAEVVVVYRALCQGQFFRLGQTGPAVGRSSDRVEPSVQRAKSLLEAAMGFTVPFGLVAAAAAYALPMRRHMHLYGTTPEQIASVALAFRAHSHHNPRAVMGAAEMTLADHQASPMIADPFRLFDCCLESDGACAVVVTSAERARDLAKPAVTLLSSAQGAPEGFGYGAYVNVDMADEIYASGGCEGLARRLFDRAGLAPGDVDVAQIYDHFGGLVLMQLEDFGFCERGEGGPFAESGALSWPGGSLPTNTHGGSLSEAYIHGLNHVVEGVRALRGESTCPLDDAEVCLVTSAACVPSSALLLGRS